MSNETVRTTAEEVADPGQLKEVFATLIQAIPKRLLSDDAGIVIARKGEFIADVLKVFDKHSVDGIILRAIEEWENFYEQEFELSCSFMNIEIPKYRRGFNRLLIIPPGITANLVYHRSRNYFTCSQRIRSGQNSLDDFATIRGEGQPRKKAYGVWLRDRAQVDRKYRADSSDEVLDQGVASITLLERLIYGLKYFQETGKHLDTKTTTRCDGSRAESGDVPEVRVNSDGEVEVLYTLPGSGGVMIGTREVVI